MTPTTDPTAEVQRISRWLAEQPCPNCRVVEEDDDDEPISEGCITKGDARKGTLEIYGCTTCGGSGGGLETDSSLEGYPEGVASWNERMKRVGAEYGSGLAFRWASEECSCISAEPPIPACWRCAWGKHSNDCESCWGSGRAPKAVGLDLIMEYKPQIGLLAMTIEAEQSRREARPADYTLAALRAIAKSLQP